MWGNTIKTDERVIGSMIKYSLGRTTYTPSMAQDVLKKNIHLISDYELNSILKLIIKFNYDYSSPVDIIGWGELNKCIAAELLNRKEKNIFISQLKNRVEVNEQILTFAIRHGLKSTDNDYIFLIDECLTNANLFSKKNLTLLIRDINEKEIYGTDPKYIDTWDNLAKKLEEYLHIVQ